MKTLDARIRFTGERRQVTALFYDIVGSTELLLRSEPEKFFRSVSALHQSAEAIIKKHGGFLHQRLGDGGCCFFGYPEQSEDAAESAVRAALELLRLAAGAKGKARTPFRLRIGVATGLVVFSTEGDEIVGTAPVLAARLQAEAEPNSVLVADNTVQLTRQKFEYSLLREARLKGFDEPIALWRPRERDPAASEPVPPQEPDRPIRGREQELAALASAWNSALANKGSLIAIVGEAGIGKSRLVGEFARNLQGSANEAVVFQCGRRMESQPLHPFVSFLERLVGDASVLKEGNAHAVKQALQASGRQVDDAAVETILAFTADLSPAPSRNLRVSDLSGRAFRRKVIEAAADMLTCKAPGIPTLLIFEDVHWADDMTLELIDRLGALAAGLPILVVQTSRIRRSLAVATEIELSGLTATAVRDLVASIWREHPPPGLSDFVLDQCDGMPLYAEELTNFLRERQPLGTSLTAWKGLLREGGVSSLNDLLSARLAATGSARRAAQFASVIGREFSISLLAYLLEGVSRQKLDTDIDRLLSQGIIERSSVTHGSFQFRHVLAQEAAYGSLLKSDRRRIHRRIADRLIGETKPSLPAAIAAWQCAEAGLHDAAARFALAAAEACVLRSAMREANVSLELCEREVDSLSRRHPDRTELALSLFELRGVVAAALEGEGSQSARRVYARAMQFLKKQPPALRMKHFPVYWGWWFTAPNILTQQSRARIVVGDMQAVEDRETRLQSYHCGWATSFHAGEHAFCLDCVAKGLDLYEADSAVRNRAFFGGHDAKVCGLGESALSYLLLNETGASEDAIRACLEWGTATDHAGSMVHALYYAMVLARCQSRYADVHALGEQMLSLAERHGLAASQARANMYCGWAELMTSPAGRGAARFEAGLLLQQQLGTDDNFSMHSDMHAQVLQRRGRPAEALAIVQNAISVGRSSGQWFWLAELYRLSAKLRRDVNDAPSSIRRDLTKAVQIAEGQKAAWLAERAKRSLAGLQGNGSR
ncbi:MULTISPECIES: ATP-binding protein [Rhizobium]|uniref:AAA family ATPase n=1 Tax=Rhizobium phaseoli TaxID=396 RepID=A0A192TJT6_9HYPH|nr:MULTISPECIES: AAA family ATPase [Rhizobium]MDH6648400.1 putative ATPase/class 3 adenylate cyclase [Rhizobium esperanzae]ANL43196.1 adenylate/guanylate cyclase protein [Rhizobium phaseoli]ANL56195.1 adenylate/guanylate cyclase protein [Rhizobium phaseoli]ANL62182.1 adenylate/guanylate cyclase protein [Rhizobium phaseoli]ANL87595.1 adenylate/guanylate cyclase protein [Rhizobium phaseoli]